MDDITIYCPKADLSCGNCMLPNYIDVPQTWNIVHSAKAIIFSYIIDSTNFTHIVHLLYTSVGCIDLALKVAQMVGKSFKRHMVLIPFRNLTRCNITCEVLASQTTSHYFLRQTNTITRACHVGFQEM